MAKATHNNSLLSPMLAGMTAGAVEGFITYPTEFVKTQLQLQNSTFKGPFECVKQTLATKGITGLYK